MTNPRYFTNLFLDPLDEITTYLEYPDWKDDVTDVTISSGSSSSFSLSIKVDSVENIYDDTGAEIPESDYSIDITGDREITVTNDSDSDITISEIKYMYKTDYSNPSFGDINWQRLEPPLLMIVPDIFSVEEGYRLINRVRFNFLYERSYKYSDFESNADQVFTLIGLIIAQLETSGHDIGDINIGEIETFQGEINDNYLESLSVELIYTTMIDWDEYHE